MTNVFLYLKSGPKVWCILYQRYIPQNILFWNFLNSIDMFNFCTRLCVYCNLLCCIASSFELLNLEEFLNYIKYIHWINQNWLTILQDRSKTYISMCCQVFWVVKLLFESKLWYAYSHFCNLKDSKSDCFSCQNTEVNFCVPMQRYVLLIV